MSQIDSQSKGQLGLRANAEGLAGLAAIPVHIVDIRVGFARVSRSVT